MVTQLPLTGPCIYCEGETPEGRFWMDDCPEINLKGSWLYAHTNCQKLQALKMEEYANKRLKKHPDDVSLQVMARLFESVADKVCHE